MPHAGSTAGLCVPHRQGSFLGQRPEAAAESARLTPDIYTRVCVCVTTMHHTVDVPELPWVALLPSRL